MPKLVGFGFRVRGVEKMGLLSF